MRVSGQSSADGAKCPASKYFLPLLLAGTVSFSGCFTQELPNVDYVGKTKADVLKMIFAMPDEPRVLDNKVVFYVKPSSCLYYGSFEDASASEMLTTSDRWIVNFREAKRSLIPVPWFCEDQAWTLNFDSAGRVESQKKYCRHPL